VPEREYFEVFDTCVRPFYKKIVSNERETLSLVKLRDALLPKLISGELRIKEAEKLLKEKGL
jgi:type I restriction enzyme S subunit